MGTAFEVDLSLFSVCRVSSLNHVGSGRTGTRGLGWSPLAFNVRLMHWF